MATRLTRRQMAAALAGAAPLLQPAALTAQEAKAQDLLETARRHNSESIRKMEKVELPLSSDPAFVFKP